MNLILSPASKFFVAVNANAATGGPELLHQLVHNLRSIGYQAYMYYLPNNHPHPVHESYEIYDNPFVREIDDDEHNVLIVPEMYEIIRIFDDYKNIQKVIWWLSVDNFIVSKCVFSPIKKNILRIGHHINRIMHYPLLDIPNIAFALNRRISLFSDKYLSMTHCHFVQSHYAYDYLLSINVDPKSISYLSDYLNDEFLDTRINMTHKEDIVLYNPAKGFRFTKKIIKMASDLNFIPIQNLSRNEVKDLLCRAKVYIDFGNHPGKDRMPREAVMCGCCVITGRRGSAANNFDININDKYKFESQSEQIYLINACIRKCITNYQDCYFDFNQYCNCIANEKKTFIDDLKSIIDKYSHFVD